MRLCGMESSDSSNTRTRINGGGSGSNDCETSNLHITTNHQVSSAINKSIKLNQSHEPDLDLVEFIYDLGQFPESLLIEILIRVSIKSLFQFKCVSKYWRSLISHPSFARFYVSKRLNCDYHFRILYRYIYVPEFKQVLDRFRPDVYASPEFSVIFLSTIEALQRCENQFKVLAVSNGLIMFCSLGPEIYYLCDPVTRQWITLPKTHSASLEIFFGEGLVTRINEDNVITSYKAVRVNWHSDESDFLKLETFSSETGVWTRYKLNCPKRIRLVKHGVGPVLFKGILHWFVHNHGMVAFDPYKDTNQCRLIQFPRGRDIESECKRDGLYRLLDGCQGKLRYFEVAPEPSEHFCFKMWVLDEYEKGEWFLELQVTRSDLWSNDDNLSSWLPCATFIPLCFHPFDLNVVYLRCIERSCIVSYNIRAKSLDVSYEPIGGFEDLSWHVVTPLVFPMWPTPFPFPARKDLYFT